MAIEDTVKKKVGQAENAVEHKAGAAADKSLGEEQHKSEEEAAAAGDEPAEEKFKTSFPG